MNLVGHAIKYCEVLRASQKIWSHDQPSSHPCELFYIAVYYQYLYLHLRVANRSELLTKLFKMMQSSNVMCVR